MRSRQDNGPMLSSRAPFLARLARIHTRCLGISSHQAENPATQSERLRLPYYTMTTCVSFRAIISTNDDIRYESCPQMPKPDHSDTDAQMSVVAKALGHPARLKILRLLARTPGCIGGEIVDAVGLAQSTVSEHLRILKAAGVIEGQIDPPRVCYSLAPNALAPLAGMLHDLEVAGQDAGTCITPTKEQ